MSPCLLESHSTPGLMSPHPHTGLISLLLSSSGLDLQSPLILHVLPCTLVIYYSTPRQTQTLADSIEFYYNNTAWRDFEIKFMIFNLNSFRVLGPLAIMDHTWTLGGDLSTGNWNENLNGKLWFWIWKSHGAHKEYFSFYCMLVDELWKESGLVSFHHWGDDHMVA